MIEVKKKYIYINNNPKLINFSKIYFQYFEKKMNKLHNSDYAQTEYSNNMIRCIVFKLFFLYRKFLYKI